MLQQATDGPRGALFALPALRELAATPWGLHLDAAAQATLRAWAASTGPGDGAAAGSLPSRPSPQTTEDLSPREAEVLTLMARGMSNKLIARELELSPHTVKRHVAHILDKLDAWLHAARPPPGTTRGRAREPRRDAGASTRLWPATRGGLAPNWVVRSRKS
jgi:DNA-binding CsgD family transcriptional regulator